MSQKIYLTILKTGIYLCFLSVFLVFKGLLFPYITSKQIYFNILIEILFVFWLAFIVKYPQYRPRKSWISFGLIGFFIAMILSCFVSVDFNLSFWGDVERMLGVFHLLHFLVFYFIIITVMRSWRDWRSLLIISVIAAVLVCLYGFIKNEHYSTIGNTAYVSGYAIFNIYFALILFFHERNWGIKSLYLIAAMIMLAVFKLTHTRGAYVGLGVSVFVMLLLFIMLSKNKKIKICCLSALAVIVVSVSLVFAYSDSAIVRESSILRTITQISSQAVTFQTRLIAWKAAIKDFPHHPILGTGHGNFAITFDKYFDPTFYNYTRSETYFDRAHNNIIDIASTTGILGLLTYLSIFAAVAYYLIKGFKDGRINANEFILLTSLIIAYFIQNLAVFDSLVTYISLMTMLGFIYWLSQGERGEIFHQEHSFFINKEIYILFIASAVMTSIIYQFNIKPLQMLRGTINGQVAFAKGDTIGGIEEYKKALSYKTVLDRDSRASLIRVITSRGYLLSKIDKEKQQEILDWTIELAKENVKYNPQDSMMQMQLAQVLNTAASFHNNNLDKLYFYSNQAEEAINKSIAASPGRVPIYFIKAQIYLTRGDKNKAIETLKYAVSLNEDYYDSTCQLARVYLAFNQQEEGFKEMDKCLDMGGAEILNSAGAIKGLINHYVDQQDRQKVIKLTSRLSKLEPNNAQVWVNLAKLYAQEGDKKNAIRAAKKASELDKNLAGAVEEFIRGLEE